MITSHRRPKPRIDVRLQHQLDRSASSVRTTPPSFKPMTRQMVLFPILLFQVYLTISVIVFAFGPVPFAVHDPALLYSFVAISQIAIFIGYLVGATDKPHGYRPFVSAKYLLFASVICNLAVLVPTLRYRGSSELSTMEALLDPGAAYHSKAELQANLDESNLELSLPRVILAPLLALMVPLGIVYWRLMSINCRLLWFVALGGTLLSSLLIGTNKGIFEVALPVPWLVWLYHRRKPDQTGPKIAASLRTSSWRFYKICTVAVLLIGSAFSYFTFTMYSRAAEHGVEFAQGTVGWSGRYGIELPMIVEYGTYQFCAYLSQGYYGLSECLELPFDPCFGIGNSMFLSRRIGPYLGMGRETAISISYPGRLEGQTGYSASIYWHTIYPWIASDLTFAGAIVFMGVMAAFFAQAWMDALRGENPFALGAFCSFLMMFLYIPANNTIFSYPEPLFAFCGNFALWRLSRKP